MKKVLRIVSFVLALSTVLCFATACKKENGDSEEPEDDVKITVTQEYIITRADGTANVGLAKELKQYIKDNTGLSLELREDWVRDPSQIPAKEILVGKCDREESKAAYEKLGDGDWTVLASGEKIVIAGNTVKALSDAVNYFVETYVKGKSVIEMSVSDSYSGNSATELIYFNWSEGELYDAGINGGYPRLYALKDGTMLLGYDGMYVSRSTDNGRTWKEKNYASKGYVGTANAAFFQDEEGIVYLGFRSTGYNDDGSFFSSIQVSYSKDNGVTWEHHSTVYENLEPTGVYKGVWEPHFGMMNGYLTCFYANDSTNITTYQNIEYKQWDPEAKEWINRTIVCNGEEHESRDGMPVWQQLSTGEYVCVVEAFNKSDNNCFAVKLTWSEDGKKWSTPVTVMSAKKSGTVCAAPFIVELPTGQLVISCQTNENTKTKEIYTMSTVISDGTPVRYISEINFSEHDYPYYGAYEFASTMWNGMYIYNGYIFTCSISSNLGIRICRYKFGDKLQQS
ncbi:MAG: exo-alpha-sialidase [Ruminococcaceae bacterium]|nr:exo-alpha-sialidase [Oscillospiraceae bacterium]